MSKRVVITALGTLGDLNPLLALAVGLRARGHEVVIATGEGFHDLVVDLDLRFHPIAPHAIPSEFLTPSDDPDVDTANLIRDLLFPQIRQSYDDLRAAAGGADLLVTQMLSFAGPIVAATTGIPWVSAVFQPLAFFSHFDPFVLLNPLAPPGVIEVDETTHRRMWRLGWQTVHSWAEPIRELRLELGAPPGSNPIFEDHHSPDLVLAMFSPTLGARRPDWPAQTRVTGFAFDDGLIAGSALPPGLPEFLDAGAPPVVFTLGSHAPFDTGEFFAKSIEAALLLGCRAVLLGAGAPALLARRNLPASVARNLVAFDYAPYAAAFPRAAVVVHHGGIGTIALAMRAGRPMLLVPCGFDQPDNSVRAARLGSARIVAQPHYTPVRAAGEVWRLLSDPRLTLAARALQRDLAGEDGAASACDALEAYMRVPRVSVMTGAPPVGAVSW